MEDTSQGVTIPMPFLVASGLPITILIGCDILRQHSAIINLQRGDVSLTTEEGIWTADLVNRSNIPSITTSCPIIQNYFCHNSHGRVLDEGKDEELWSSKLEEIRTFQREGQDQQISIHQAEELINIYNRYRHIFSDAPGKVKDYQCTVSYTHLDVYKRQVTSLTLIG